MKQKNEREYLNRQQARQILGGTPGSGRPKPPDPPPESEFLLK